jgi:uncharacterized membrane-anchored protein
MDEARSKLWHVISAATLFGGYIVCVLGIASDFSDDRSMSGLLSPLGTGVLVATGTAASVFAVTYFYVLRGSKTPKRKKLRNSMVAAGLIAALLGINGFASTFRQLLPSSAPRIKPAPQNIGPNLANL